MTTNSNDPVAEQLSSEQTQQPTSRPLQDFKDELSRQATGMTKKEAFEKGVCIICQQPQPLSRCYSDAGRKEYYISAVCEPCFDEMFKESEEDVDE